LAGQALSGRAFEDGFEVVEPADLMPHLPGDHRRHELHEPSGSQVKGKANPDGLVRIFGQLEHADRARGPGNDMNSSRRGWQAKTTS
jgi:hypothetical protein